MRPDYCPIGGEPCQSLCDTPCTRTPHRTEQKPVAWKLMPREATREMLEAMDECSTEGYDERLYAGHAASVYMAAWDASDTHPPQRTWVGLTKDEVDSWNLPDHPTVFEFAQFIESKLKEKNI